MLGRSMGSMDGLRMTDTAPTDWPDKPLLLHAKASRGQMYGWQQDAAWGRTRPPARQMWLRMQW